MTLAPQTTTYSAPIQHLGRMGAYFGAQPDEQNFTIYYPQTLEGNMGLSFTATGFNPTHGDVKIVRLLLQGIRLPSLMRFPPELALSVLALADYYPRLESRRDEAMQYAANNFQGPWNPGPPEPDPSVAGLYLTSPPIPRPEERLGETTVRTKRITFQMKSADQGWATFGGDGTYENSHTWFDASILAPSDATETNGGFGYADLSQKFRTPTEAREALRGLGWEFVQHDGMDTWRVHNNITAQSKSSDYRVDWVLGLPTEVEDPLAMGDGQGFLEKLAPGCVVALWARAEVGQEHTSAPADTH